MKKVFFILWLSTITLFATSQICIQCDTNSNAIGNYSSVLGMSAIASGQTSMAAGLEVYAEGNYSFALGKYVTTYGSSSVAIGRYLETSSSPAMIIGAGAGLSSSEILYNGISNSLMIGFNSNKPTLFVGMSDGVGYTGSIGIGDVTDPQAKLHIKSDDGEIAMIFIEPYTFSGGESARLRLGTMDYGISAGYGRLYFNTGGNYIFNSSDAKVGIGTPTPTEKLEVDGNIKVTDGNIFIDNNEGGVILKSPDGQCWKITVNNSGELISTLIDCNLITENNNETQLDTEHFRVYPNPSNNKFTIESSYDSYHMVKVTDMNGALVIAEEIYSGTNELSLKNLTNGYYVVTIIDEGNKTLFSEKIIKN